MNTPDLTKAQLLVLTRAILAVLVAFGVGLDSAQQTALLALVGTLGAFTLLADAIIRHGRARSLSPGLNLVNTPAPARRTVDPAVAGAVATNQTFTSPPAAPAPMPAVSAVPGTPQPIPGT